MTKPYYQDDLVTLFHGDSREVLTGMADKSVDVVITDPPYSDSTHAGARVSTGKGRKLDLSNPLTFGSISAEELREVFEQLGRVTKSWIVSNLDYKHAFEFDWQPPVGLRMLRIGVWVKSNPMPQISGDRPGQGWEAIAFMHRDDIRPKWNGGGRSGVWTTPTSQGTGHPTTKPLTMVRDWVRLFTDPGQMILDPFVGSGTTLRAAADEGRRAVGWEIDERYCEIAAKRLGQQAFDLGDWGDGA